VANESAPQSIPKSGLPIFACRNGEGITDLQVARPELFGDGSVTVVVPKP